MPEHFHSLPPVSWRAELASYTLSEPLYAQLHCPILEWIGGSLPPTPPERSRSPARIYPRRSFKSFLTGCSMNADLAILLRPPPPVRFNDRCAAADVGKQVSPAGASPASDTYDLRTQLDIPSRTAHGSLRYRRLLRLLRVVRRQRYQLAYAIRHRPQMSALLALCYATHFAHAHALHSRLASVPVDGEGIRPSVALIRRCIGLEGASNSAGMCTT
uniref:Uncharacterized protein n=1 Tax=Mycena chlorophos TaxID=658473 RepID=A0ABQ0LUI7_MYCCL|nr:predicted protein [Mycena chlorophos]